MMLIFQIKCFLIQVVSKYMAQKKYQYLLYFKSFSLHIRFVSIFILIFISIICFKLLKYNYSMSFTLIFFKFRN